MVSEWELISRLVLAVVLGAVLGLERESNHKTAGTRTHALVALGAALYTISGAFFGDEVTLNPTRVAAQVVSGIGFIGGGAILRSGFTVTGITTAASLWMAAAFGVAAGMGLYWVAAAAGLLAFIVIVALGRVADLVLGRRGLANLEMYYAAGHSTLGFLFSELRGAGGVVRGMQLIDDDTDRHVVLSATGISAADFGEIVQQLEGRAEVTRIVSSAGGD
ncbi:MAG: MgtC/SapB family protein [Acidimicrobiales bacterium]